MPPKKKKKLSKSERRKIHQAKGKKGSECRGEGVGARKRFVLPALWEDEQFQCGEQTKEKFISPGKTVYRTHKDVEAALVSRDCKDCLFDASASSAEDKSDEDAHYSPFYAESSQVKIEAKKTENASKPEVEEIEIERRMFVCESTQLADFVGKINATSKCATPGCNGILVLLEVQPTGLGGTLNATFTCNDCQIRTICFKGSAFVEGSKRTVVGLALGVAFMISGHGFAKFEKTLKQCLGISCLSKNRFYEILKLVYPHVKDILDEMCDEEKDRMIDLADEELGSWKRAVVTSDGVWHTRGHFSKNGSFVIKNYLTGGLLWYGHKCMKGSDDVVDEDLFEGTSRAMEGTLADECYKQAKDEGCSVECVWQDGDSSSAKCIPRHHTNAKVYKCGGHVGRAHCNALKDAAKKKEFSADMKRKYKEKFPLVESTKCMCSRHRADCGCLSENFIKGARINHFCCLQQCKDPQEYARRMRVLGSFHCRNIHEWDGGECGFHAKRRCTCKKCDEEIQCEGEAYQTRNPLKCEYHWLAYQIECERRAEDADSIIHPTMGRGHSNLCEAHFSVLPQFRSKDQSLSRLHYITSTNSGLCQGNMSWCYDVRGANYHWVIDLYERLNLPVIPAIVRALHQAVSDRRTSIQKLKTAVTKQNRINMKVARAEDQESRKKWGRQQAIRHTYGNDEDDIIEGEVDQRIVGEAREMFTEGDGGNTTVVSKRSSGCCKCGSKEHMRTSHKACPLNKKKL